MHVIIARDYQNLSEQAAGIVAAAVTANPLHDHPDFTVIADEDAALVFRAWCARGKMET